MHASNQLNVVLQIVPPQPVPSNQARNMVKGVQHFWTSFSSNEGSKLVSRKKKQILGGLLVPSFRLNKITPLNGCQEGSKLENE